MTDLPHDTLTRVVLDGRDLTKLRT